MKAPSRTPDGRSNPEYYREYRKTLHGKKLMKLWNDSESGEKSRRLHRLRKAAQRREGESDDDFLKRREKIILKMEKY